MSRSKTPESNPEKYRREIVEQLLAQWERMPACRLGQMLSNATTRHVLFYLEDVELTELVKRHVDDCLS
jgi:hypothetical protein